MLETHPIAFPSSKAKILILASGENNDDVAEIISKTQTLDDMWLV